MHEPKTELTVAGSVGVPAGERREEVAQPRALQDEGGETRVRHGGDRGEWAATATAMAMAMAMAMARRGGGRVGRSRCRRLVVRWFAAQNGSSSQYRNEEWSCDLPSIKLPCTIGMRLR